MSDRETILFPWLPGEGARLPDPAFTYRDDSEPPPLLMLTLRLLAEGANASGPAPAEWLAGIEVDALNAPIRAFARERFGLLDIYNNESGRHDWYEGGGVILPDASVVTVARPNALERCWRGYATFLLKELAGANETAAQALARISTEWERWKQARATAFVAAWRDVAAWPPALALSWIMFAGDWPRIAHYLRNGKEMPASGIFLNAVGSWLTEADHDAPHRDASERLWAGMRSGAVIVYGVPGGQGGSGTIEPADLLTLNWADDPPGSDARLERHGLTYTNVLIDRASLQKPPTKSTGDLIRDAANGVPQGTRAKARNDAIRITFRDKGLTQPSDTKIKEALKGTPHLKARRSRPV